MEHENDTHILKDSQRADLARCGEGGRKLKLRRAVGKVEYNSGACSAARGPQSFGRFYCSYPIKVPEISVDQQWVSVF